ncbi:uncharacterized protein LOC127726689 isoform X1 [Mytilus californianus]|uniref:uncharacterized protein LOC127726689 isoform X1 n=1 Tax=Mytilus californianus TaxID=6549 RepID=UPI00224836F8|nr:uncharacterized protein LOC127726689 isoform X1 [Mytilus californianus]
MFQETSILHPGRIVFKQQRFVHINIVRRLQKKSTMGQLLIVLINALFLSVVTANMDMKFGYDVIEGNARYSENIETNLEKNVVKIHTPAHNDVMESYQIQDFSQGQQMKCLPSLKQCRLRDIEGETEGDAGQVTEGFIHSWNKGDKTINSTNEVVVTEMYYADFDEIIDYNSLGQSLKEFYQDFKYPLYKEIKVPKDAEVFNMTSSLGSRTKRKINWLSNGCRGQGIKTVYGIDSGRTCNHLKLCESRGILNGVNVFTDCDNVHITSPTVYRCICCPWVTPTTGDCNCVTMSR